MTRFADASLKNHRPYETALKQGRTATAKDGRVVEGSHALEGTALRSTKFRPCAIIAHVADTAAIKLSPTPTVTHPLHVSAGR